MIAAVKSGELDTHLAHQPASPPKRNFCLDRLERSIASYPWKIAFHRV